MARGRSRICVCTILTITSDDLTSPLTLLKLYFQVMPSIVVLLLKICPTFVPHLGVLPNYLCVPVG